MANANWPIVSWAAVFGADPNQSLSGKQWSDLSPRVLAWDAGYGTQYELNAVEAGTANLDMRNDDEALNAANTSSPFNSGGNTLAPYRALQGFAHWPLGPDVGLGVGGNLLNDVNAAQWGFKADTRSFEGGTLGEWILGGTTPPTIAVSSVRAHEGTKSMLITWPTAANGGTNSVSLVWALNIGPLKIGQQYTASLWLWLGTVGMPKMRFQFGGAASVSTSTTGAWQRVSVTFTATTVWSQLQIYPDTNTTAGQQCWVDSVQVDIGSPATSFSDTGPTTHPLFTGYIERYPLTWQANGYFGKTRLTAVDALALLPRMTFMSAIDEEISADSPAMAYRCADHAPLNARSYSQSRSKSFSVTANNPTTSPTYALALAPDFEPGGACLDLNPTDANNFTYVCIPSAFTISGTGTTMEVWYRIGANPPFNQIFMSANGAGGHAWDVGIDTSGHVFVRVTNNPLTPTYSYTITDATDRADFGWHHVVVTESVSGGTVTGSLYVDGVLRGTATRASGAPFNIFSVNLGATGAPFLQSPFTGQVAWFAAYGSALTPTRVAAHFNAVDNGWAFDKAGDRIARLLTWIGWKGTINIPKGVAQVGPAAGLAGKNAGDVMKDIGIAEAGYFLCQPDGDLTLVTRDSFHLQTSSSLTFGENEAGGEIPYLDNVQWELDPSFIYNQITVTGSEGTLTSGTVSDAASIAKHFPSALQLDTVLVRELDLLPYAQHLLSRYKNGRLRITAVTIDPGANPNLWPVALGLKFGTRVTVKRRARGVTMTGDFYVLHRAHNVGPSSWKTTFQMVPVEPQQAWIIGDPVYGVVGSTTIPVY